MKSTDYQNLAMNTDLKDKYEPMIERLSDKRVARLLHGALGLCTEAGEIQDALKRKVMYGKELDLTNIKEEVGDLLWYCALILDEVGSSFEEVMEMNIAKLKKRYPQGFTEQDALNRNLEAESAVLNGQT